jgi:hypothetical protein
MAVLLARRADYSKATPLRCASASNGARHACPVHPPKCAGRESNPHALRHGHLRPAWLPVTPPARGADDGPRTRDLRHGEATLCLLSYIHSEPPRGIEPRTSFVPGTRSCQLSYGGMLYRLEPPAVEPPAGVEPANLGIQDRCSGQLSYRGGAGTRRGAEGAEIRPASRTVACLCPRAGSNRHCRRTQRRAPCRWLRGQSSP